MAFTRSRPRNGGWLTLVLAGLAGGPLPAQAPRQTLAQLAHRAWTAEDGAPGMIGSLAQTTDGFLWLATTTGLFRFDGVRFERYEPPAGQALPANGVSTLLALPDGPLWIGYGLGGVSVLAGGRLVSYGEGDGLPAGTVTAFARDSAGTMWAATTRGLARLVGDRWQPAGLADGYPGGFTTELTVDRRGTLWAVATAGVYARPRGALRFERRAPPLAIGEADAGGGSVHEAPDGTMWAVSMSAGLRPLTDSAGRPVPPVAYYTRDRGGYGPAWTALFIDRAAHAWGVGTRDRLVRVPLPSAGGPTASGAPFDTLALSSASGSSGRWAYSVLEDREGTVWIGTDGGLDHLRAPKFRSVPWPPSGNRAVIAAGENGAVWMGSPADPLTSLGDRLVPHPEVPPGISAMHRDVAGDVWVGGERGAWYGRAGRFAPVGLPAELRGVSIQAIARDRGGTLWVSGTRRGVFRQRQSRWERFGSAATYALAIAADGAGRTWLGYLDGRLVRVAGDAERTFGLADGLRVGSVATLHVRGGRVWVGGELGVAVIHASAAARAERVTPFAVVGAPLRGVSGIVETAAGELWLHHAAGVTRVPAAEVARALGDPTYRARIEGFDFRDRVDGLASTSWAPTLVEGTDGRLWVTFRGSVAWVDPARLRRNPVPPPVLIRGLAAGGRQYAALGAALTLPERTQALSVAYTATSLAVPERVRFRYRLIGLDTAWEEAGTRREAFYTKLDPGRYRFEVLAANEDGVWSPRPAALDVAIPPAFVQTDAFRALCAAAAGGTLWLLVLWRQRRLAGAMRARYEARFEATLAERTRVARELHDTLLTDVAAIRMQLDAAARGTGSAGVAAAVVAGIRDQMGQALVSARHAVVEMRTAPGDARPVDDQLTEAVRRTFADTDVDARVSHTGTPRRYPPAVEAEALRIGTEALANVRQHAACRRVRVTCAYAPRELRLEVRDDGRGFDPARAAANGHFGLVGMRERASAIGARLTVESAPGRGTVVRLVVPSTG